MPDTLFSCRQEMSVTVGEKVNVVSQTQDTSEWHAKSYSLPLNQA